MNDKRPTFKAGMYSRAWYNPAQYTCRQHTVYVTIADARHGMTASELRETAHFFNQLAEQMEEPGERGPDTLHHAQRLAIDLHRKHYSDNTAWQVADDLPTVIDQIDNMTAPLLKPITTIADANGNERLYFGTKPEPAHICLSNDQYEALQTMQKQHNDLNDRIYRIVCRVHDTCFRDHIPWGIVQDPNALLDKLETFLDDMERIKPTPAWTDRLAHVDQRTPIERHDNGEPGGNIDSNPAMDDLMRNSNVPPTTPPIFNVSDDGVLTFSKPMRDMLDRHIAELIESAKVKNDHRYRL